MKRKEFYSLAIIYSALLVVWGSLLVANHFFEFAMPPNAGATFLIMGGLIIFVGVAIFIRFARNDM